jgi:hypothetical protein
MTATRSSLPRLRLIVSTEAEARVFEISLPVSPGQEIGAAVERAAAAFERWLHNSLLWARRAEARPSPRAPDPRA